MNSIDMPLNIIPSFSAKCNNSQDIRSTTFLIVLFASELKLLDEPTWRSSCFANCLSEGLCQWDWHMIVDCRNWQDPHQPLWYSPVMVSMGDFKLQCRTTFAMTIINRRRDHCDLAEKHLSALDMTAPHMLDAQDCWSRVGSGPATCALQSSRNWRLAPCASRALVPSSCLCRIPTGFAAWCILLSVPGAVTG